MPYRNAIERKPIVDITLFGGNDDVDTLRELLEKEMRMPVRLKRPVLRHIAASHEVPPVHKDKLHRFSAAIGLALQGR